MAEQIEITEVLDAHDIEFRECDVCDKVFVRGTYYYLVGTIACSDECRDKHIQEEFAEEHATYLLGGLSWEFACDRVWGDLHKEDNDSFYYTELEQ